MNEIGEEHLSAEEELIENPEVEETKDEEPKCYDSDYDPNMLESEWTKVHNERKKRRRKQHIELKDLSEENFLSLIESKNQD